MINRRNLKVCVTLLQISLPSFWYSASLVMSELASLAVDQIIMGLSMNFTLSSTSCMQLCDIIFVSLS